MSSDATIRNDRRVPRVLLADADEDARTLYRESLRAAGCDVLDATDGRDALVKALTHAPSVVITETHLPIFDGYELCEILRRDSTTHAVPILVVTNEKRERELDRARDAGADAVIIKPVPPATLLREIERLLHTPPEPPPATPSQPPASAGRTRRRTLSTAHARLETTTPPLPPPTLRCPSCDRSLEYVRSHVGGVNGRQREQWDEYKCLPSCGTFVYRHRTRRLRRAV